MTSLHRYDVQKPITTFFHNQTSAALEGISLIILIVSIWFLCFAFSAFPSATSLLDAHVQLRLTFRGWLCQYDGACFRSFACLTRFSAQLHLDGSDALIVFHTQSIDQPVLHARLAVCCSYNSIVFFRFVRLLFAKRFLGYFTASYDAVASKWFATLLICCTHCLSPCSLLSVIEFSSKKRKKEI